MDSEFSCGFVGKPQNLMSFKGGRKSFKLLPSWDICGYVLNVELVLFFLFDKHSTHPHTFFQVPHCKCYKHDQSIIVYMERNCLTTELLVAQKCMLLNPLVRLRTLLLLLGYEFSLSFINGPNLSLPKIPFYDWSQLKPNQFNLSFAKTIIYHGFR